LIGCRIAKCGYHVIYKGILRESTSHIVDKTIRSAGGGRFMVAYIASPLASATTGAALRVDGGTIKSAF
jgi:hypothetical protein